MSDQPTFLHLPGDLPREELCDIAEKYILEHGGPEVCVLHFKFTCQWCGERCMLEKPNTLFENGECCECGKETPITYGGFMAQMTFK